MARKEIVQVNFIDDVTGEEGATEVKFTVFGREYSLDLVDSTNAQLQQLLGQLAPFEEAYVTAQAETLDYNRPRTYADRNALIFADYRTPGAPTYGNVSRLAEKYKLVEGSVYIILRKAEQGNFGSRRLLRSTES